MAEAPAVVRNISDTALWAAYFRAQETRRPDALFRDPYAERLEGGEGAEIAKTIPQGQSHAWAWVSRTYLFDQFIQREIASGADAIVNCAAGLDARPYRMELPASLRWFELDLPGILAYKEERLGQENRAVRWSAFAWTWRRRRSGAAFLKPSVRRSREP
jgi:methyltransferase (TIGR00027 family)